MRAGHIDRHGHCTTSHPHWGQSKNSNKSFFTVLTIQSVTSDLQCITRIHADNNLSNTEQYNKTKFILSNDQCKTTYCQHSTSGRPRKVSGLRDGSPCPEPHVTSASVPSRTVLLQVLQLLRLPISLEHQKMCDVTLRRFCTSEFITIQLKEQCVPANNIMTSQSKNFVAYNYEYAYHSLFLHSFTTVIYNC